ncbi:uncharacterized protein [Haliotis asinina]|uniref:uncharacterized protein n=1 Tax=Haliotis asinina TaxID=109174 RepID=UPI0035321BEC
MALWCIYLAAILGFVAVFGLPAKHGQSDVGDLMDQMYDLSLKKQNNELNPHNQRYDIVHHDPKLASEVKHKELQHNGDLKQHLHDVKTKVQRFKDPKDKRNDIYPKYRSFHMEDRDQNDASTKEGSQTSLGKIHVDADPLNVDVKQKQWHDIKIENQRPDPHPQELRQDANPQPQELRQDADPQSQELRQDADPQSQELRNVNPNRHKLMQDTDPQSQELGHNAKPNSQELRQDADPQSQELRHNANLNSQELRQDADPQSQELRHNANPNSQELRQDADPQSQELRHNANPNSQELRQDADPQSQKLRHNAKPNPQELRQDADPQSQELRHESNPNPQELRQDADPQSQKLRHNAKPNPQELRQNADPQSQELRPNADTHPNMQEVRSDVHPNPQEMGPAADPNSQEQGQKPNTDPQPQEVRHDTDPHPQELRPDANPTSREDERRPDAHPHPQHLRPDAEPQERISAFLDNTLVAGDTYVNVEPNDPKYDIKIVKQRPDVDRHPQKQRQRQRQRPDAEPQERISTFLDNTLVASDTYVNVEPNNPKYDIKIGDQSPGTDAREQDPDTAEERSTSLDNTLVAGHTFVDVEPQDPHYDVNTKDQWLDADPIDQQYIRPKDRNSMPIENTLLAGASLYINIKPKDQSYDVMAREQTYDVNSEDQLDDVSPEDEMYDENTDEHRDDDDTESSEDEWQNTIHAESPDESDHPIHSTQLFTVYENVDADIEMHPQSNGSVLVSSKESEPPRMKDPRPLSILMKKMLLAAVPPGQQGMSQSDPPRRGSSGDSKNIPQASTKIAFSDMAVKAMEPQSTSDEPKLRKLSEILVGIKRRLDNDRGGSKDRRVFTHLLTYTSIAVVIFVFLSFLTMMTLLCWSVQHL